MKDKIVRMIFNFIFRKVPILNWLDGHKTTISRIAAVVSATLLAVAMYFPEYAPITDQVMLAVSTLLSLVGIEIGKIDKEIKTT